MKLPLPSRGQPLDLSYISLIAQTVNSLASSIIVSKNKYSSVDTVSAGKQELLTSDLKIVAGYIEPAINYNATAGSSLSFTYSFESFKYPPIVTATPKHVSNSPTDVTLVITDITNSSVKINLKFNQTDTATSNITIGVNIIAVGVPN